MAKNLPSHGLNLGVRDAFTRDNAVIAPLTEDGGAIGGTNDGDLPDLTTPSAQADADAVRELAVKFNELLAALKSRGVLPK